MVKSAFRPWKKEKNMYDVLMQLIESGDLCFCDKSGPLTPFESALFFEKLKIKYFNGIVKVSK